MDGHLKVSVKLGRQTQGAVAPYQPNGGGYLDHNRDVMTALAMHVVPLIRYCSNGGTEKGLYCASSL